MCKWMTEKRGYAMQVLSASLHRTFPMDNKRKLIDIQVLSAKAPSWGDCASILIKKARMTIFFKKKKHKQKQKKKKLRKSLEYKTRRISVSFPARKFIWPRTPRLCLRTWKDRRFPVTNGRGMSSTYTTGFSQRDIWVPRYSRQHV